MTENRSSANLLFFDFNPTTRVVFAENGIDQLGELAGALGVRSAMIVTDSGIVAAGHVERAEAALSRSKIKATVFEGVEENPTTRHVRRGVDFARANGPVELIVGLGGGSAMDCAKGINFLLTNGGRMEDYRGVGKAAKPMLPSIGIPTTAGTGSEAQSFALIASEETHQKMACGDIKARFKTVILDPALVASASREVLAVTGMDAISHALESYVCTRRNAISQMFAKEAWRLLSANYERVLRAPDTATLSKMLLGAHLAGSAIENSMLGAAHACANPLTAHYGITHGIAVGIMLPHVVLFNSVSVNGSYSELSDMVPSRDDGVRGAVALAQFLNAMHQAGSFPTRLRDCSVREEELTALAEEASQQWTGSFNPRPVSQQDLLALYSAAY